MCVTVLQIALTPHRQSHPRPVRSSALTLYFNQKCGNSDNHNNNKNNGSRISFRRSPTYFDYATPVQSNPIQFNPFNDHSESHGLDRCFSLQCTIMYINVNLLYLLVIEEFLYVCRCGRTAIAVTVNLSDSPTTTIRN